jgi:hypothetical protein
MICPKCQEENIITIWAGLVARPIGTFSLAGAQMKVSAHRTVIAECSCCGLADVPTARIAQWCSRGTLVAAEVSDSGMRLFRPADVLAAATSIEASKED